VRETRWHPNEQVAEQSDGCLLWSAAIAEPREMLPWIRGWGADVEVLEPQDLRERILSELTQTVENYLKSQNGKNVLRSLK
jgi:predicted DNA-binding transcriptional regulator YafY